MKGCFVMLLAVAGLALGALATLREGYGAAIVTMVKNLVAGEGSGYSPQQFEADLVDQINYVRIAAKLPVTTVDAELQAWMHSQGKSLNCDDLDAVSETIRSQHPRYKQVLVCFAGSATLETLGGAFIKFAQRKDAECNAIAVMVRPKPAHLGYESLVVIGNRLDDFSPEALSAHLSDTFFSVCLHCGYEHICKVSAAQRGIEMQCNKCGKTYAVLAADSQGKFRYVNEFLTGYQPPACYATNSDRLDEMYTIWRAVVAHCSYRKDSEDPQNKRDCWQPALETQCRQSGDCEDSSIFLADWLISRGFQARVALGHYGDIGEHAWCVVRLDNVDYLLESTEGPPDPQTPPYVSDVGGRYVPETLFDRDAIYVRAHTKEPFAATDYWASRAWTRITPRSMFHKPQAGDLASRAAGAVPASKLTMASLPGVNTSLKPRSTGSNAVPLTCFPFPSLGQVPAEAQRWEVLLPITPVR